VPGSLVREQTGQLCGTSDLMVETGRLRGEALAGCEDGLGGCPDELEKSVDSVGAAVEGFDFFVVGGSSFSSVAGRFNCHDVR